jgi:agmatine/peptidylarginine deiminase
VTKSWKLWAGVGAAVVFVAVGVVVLASWAKSAAEPEPEARLPGDFEPAGAMVLACHELVTSQQTKLLAELLRAAAGKTPAVLLANQKSQELAVRNALVGFEMDVSRFRFVQAAHESSRIGRYGPLWVDRPSGKPALIDAPRHRVEPSGGNRFALDLAEGLDLPIVRLALYLSRGNLIANGQGVAITTTGILDQNADLGWDEQIIRRTLRQALGIKELVILATLEGEPTGYVERFATFTSLDTVVVGQFDSQREATNAAILEESAKALAEVEVEPGKMLKVERIPMPPRRPGVWRSYTPVAFLNDALLVPVYGGIDAAGREQALETYKRLLPNRTIVPIDMGPYEAASVTPRSLVLPIGGAGE